MSTEIPKILVITRATICEKFKVNGSVARGIIRELASKGVIKRVGDASAKFDLFTGTQAKSIAQREAEEKAAEEKAKNKGKK